MIRSTDMRNGTAASVAERRREARARQAEQGSQAIGWVGLFLAGCGWLAGARFTVDGWIVFLNEFLSWLFSRFGVKVEIPIPTWWVYLILMLVLGFLYSRVELDYVPVAWPEDWQRDFFDTRAWYIAPWPVWMIFSVIIVSDLGTTFLGIQRPPPGSWEFITGISKNLLLSGLTAIMVTFLPERLGVWSWKRLRRG